MKKVFLILLLCTGAWGSHYYECMEYDGGPVIAKVDLVNFKLYEDKGKPGTDSFFCPGIQHGIPLLYNNFGTKDFEQATYRYFEVSGADGGRRVHIRIYNPQPVRTWGKARFKADIFSTCRPELWATDPAIPGGPICYGF